MQWMKKHKHILIGSVFALIVLIAAFFYGGNSGMSNLDDTGNTGVSEEFMSIGEGQLSSADGTDRKSENGSTARVKEADTGSRDEDRKTEESGSSKSEATEAASHTSETSTSESTEGDTGKTTETTEEASTEGTTEASTETTTEQPASDSCTISISCATVLSHMDELDPAKVSCVPANGVILGSTTIYLSDGDTVYDVLRRACNNAGIALDTAGGSTYVRGINNLYEFDCGPQSGWMYSVNGVYSNYGCDSYKVKNGDVIRWNYTCVYGDL